MTASLRAIVPAATHGLTALSGAVSFALGATRATVGYSLIGLLVVGWVVVIVVRVSRHRGSPVAPPLPLMETEHRTSHPRPGPVRETPQTQDPGWYWDPDHMTEQAYWDGLSWTARRRWDGSAWVDVPGGSPS